MTAQDVTVLEASIEETRADRATKRTFHAYFEIGEGVGRGAQESIPCWIVCQEPSSPPALAAARTVR